jgi:hypothetical protein
MSPSSSYRTAERSWRAAALSDDERPRGLPARHRRRYPCAVTIAADYSSPREPIHFSRVFDGRTPALCGKNGTPCPAANEWRYVGCPRCLALRPPEVHARPSADAKALCGMAPDGKRWTRKRSEVSCTLCREAVERLQRTSERRT